MTNQDLKTFAHIIETEGIDAKTASTLLKKLKKSEQKILAQKLKTEIQKGKITVTSAQKIDTVTQKNLMEIFGKEKINIIEETNLGAGMIIQDNDTIYDTSFKGRLNNTLTAVAEAL